MRFGLGLLAGFCIAFPVVRDQSRLAADRSGRRGVEIIKYRFTPAVLDYRLSKCELVKCLKPAAHRLSFANYLPRRI